MRPVTLVLIAIMAIYFIYAMNLLNIIWYLLNPESGISLLVPTLCLIAYELNWYLNHLLISHGVDRDNLEKLL